MVIIKAGFPAPVFDFTPSFSAQNLLEEYVDTLPDRYDRFQTISLDDVPHPVFNEIISGAESGGILLNTGTVLMMGLKNASRDGHNSYTIYVKDQGDLNDPY
jgi:hypothetical protein